MSLVGLWNCFQPSPPTPCRRGCRGGEHWSGHPPALTTPSPARPWRGTAPHSPLPLSAFQDRTMGSPAHPLISAPSTTSEVMRPLSNLCRGERRTLSTGQDQAIPAPNWGSFPQPSASP